MDTRTSKRAQKNGQYPKLESIGSIGSIILAILEVQVPPVALGTYLSLAVERQRSLEVNPGPRTQIFQKAFLKEHTLNPLLEQDPREPNIA